MKSKLKSLELRAARWVIPVLSGAFVSAAIAQSTLEWNTTTGGPAGVGPTATATVSAQSNIANPSNNIFTASSPNTLQVTATLSNQQYTGNGVSSVGSVAMGSQGNSTAMQNVNIYQTLSGIGTPADSMFSSLSTTVGQGISTTANGALHFHTSTRGLQAANLATNTRNYMADLTISFSYPLTNPVVHFSGFGGSYTVGGGGTLGFTTELELDTSAPAGVTLSKLSGTTVMNVTGNNILNSAALPGASCATNVAACGSVLVTGQNVTSLKFRVYLRGDGGTARWHAASGNQSFTGDTWYFAGVSSLPPADLAPVFSNLPTVLKPGQTATGLTLTCTNAGPFTASSSTCAPSASAGVVSGLSCTPTPPATVPVNGTVVCTFDYQAPVSGSSVTLTGTTGSPNDTSGGTTTGGNNQVTAAIPIVPSDVSASITGLPAVSAPGATVNGSITCRAVLGTPNGVTCTATAVDSNGAPVPVTVGTCSPPVPIASLATNATTTCAISYVTPGTPGGSDTLPNNVVVTAIANERDDSNPLNNTAPATVPIIDAVNDAAGFPGGTTGATTNLTPNDSFPLGSTFTQVSSTCAASSVSSVGIATYNVPASGSCVVNYQVCAPSGTPCDTAALTVTGTPSDMTPVFSGIPAISSPGSLVNGTITCTNVITGTPTAPATQATCSATAVDSNGAPVAVTVGPCTPPTPVASLAVSGTITCPISYTTPGTPGGTETVPTSVSLTGVTGALNDNNSGNNQTPAIVPIIDAVNDADGKPGGTLGAQTNLFPNDDFPTNSVFTVEPGGTCANASVATTGTATYDVPSSGSCTVNYKVCAPAPNQLVCDVARLTVTASAADMTAVVSAPQASSPGAVVNGTITCTNLGSSAASATNATCTATAVDNNGIAVPVTVTGCSPTPPATVAIGANITCNVSYTTPGTPGGSNTTPTSVKLTAATGAANDSNPGNNTDPTVIPIVDAVDDAPGYPGGTLGATTPLNVNDQTVPGSVFTVESGGTCANASVAVNGLATYDVPPPLGSCTVNYKVCAPTPNGSVCDTATMTVAATPADMTPTFSGLPAASAPGSTVTGTITCTNVISPTGGGSATAATCNATAVDSASNPVPVAVTGCAPPVGSDIAVGGSITCTVSYTTPGSPGGADTAPTSVTLTGLTGSTNDVNAGNNTTPAFIPIIDALDDVAAYPGGTTGATTDLTPNDQFPLGSVFSYVAAGSTCPAASVSSEGVATYNVPATTACVVNYQVCAPAPNSTQCDTAMLTVTATLADMTAAVAVPSAASPGATVNGTITCTNLSGTAVGATCTATAQDQSGLSVPLTVTGCAPTPPVTRAVGETIRCNVSYTMPGTPGGTDTGPTSVTVTAATSAINDSVPGNNTAPGVTVIVDALDDVSNVAFAVAGSINVLTNDTNGTATATPSNVTATVVTAPTSGSTFDPATGLFSVPGTADPGVYTVEYQICVNPAVTPVACDTATASITVAGAGAADMSAAVAVPSAASPGATVNGTITCTNILGTAVDATCTATAQDQGGADVPVTVTGCTPTPPVTRTLGQTIQCNVSYTMPGPQGGTDTAATSVTVTAATSATNDSVPGNNTAPGVTVIVDALDDARNVAFGVASSISVLTNDTNGTATATPSNITATVVAAPTAGSTFDPATGVFSVPATATPGLYTVQYQICVNPAVTPVACDTATASITVAAPGAPVAVNDSASTSVNTPITVATPITSNDSGAAIKVRNITGFDGATCPTPLNTSLGGDQSKAGASCVVGGVAGATCTVPTTHGSVTVCQDGTYTYTPTNGYVGTDSFNYQIVDSAGQFATATVNLTVTGLPDVTTKVRLQSASPTPGLVTTVFVDFANIGPSVANGVVVTLQMAPGLSGVAPSNGGVYNAATGLVTWPAIPNIPGNTPAAGTYSVNFIMPTNAAALDFTSTASVPGGETSTGNNPSTVSIGSTVAVPTLSDIALLLLGLIMVSLAARKLRRR
jgi:hypothetical protein